MYPLDMDHSEIVFVIISIAEIVLIAWSRIWINEGIAIKFDSIFDSLSVHPLIKFCKNYRMSENANEDL